MLRLNTGIAPTLATSQSNLGVLGGDTRGVPNGRRPGDDVVDIELRAAMGVLCTLNAPATFGCVPADAPTGNLRLHGRRHRRLQAISTPRSLYLKTPIAGSPSN